MSIKNICLRSCAASDACFVNRPWWNYRISVSAA